MPYTRVKICGITRYEDAVRAVEAGVDAIGLNFFAGPRKIFLDRAAEILAGIPPLVTPVGLTSGPTVEFPDAPTIQEIQSGPVSGGRAPLRISTIQYYGKNLFLEDGPRPFTDVWSVWRIHPGDIGAKILSHFPTFRASTIVIDAASPALVGGTGLTLDWQELADALYDFFRKEAFDRVILAGGLTPQNVAEAIRIVRPYAVDVSSGVEVAGKPGVKDPLKMRDFIQAAKGV